jgi:predicted AlkP superfamily pyrophosphatase or phosphodiesterase
MINHKSFDAVAKSGWKQQFCKPLYDSYSFSKIPGTLLKLLGQEGDALPADCWTQGEYDRVVLILIDGFGWNFLEKNHEKYPFLSRFFRKGIVSKITSQFPSTTAAHITCLTTGLEVGQSGVFEWFYYEPLLDRVIAPLLYSFAGDKKVGSLQSMITPDKLLPATTIFQKLQKSNIHSYIFHHESIANSTYSNWMFRGGEIIPYHDYSDCMRKVISKMEHKGLFYVYIGDVDAESHRHGIDSKETHKAIENCFNALEELFWKKHTAHPKTAFILTADHGMTPIDPKTTVYLNQAVPKLEPYLKKGRDGHVLAPAGSCRDYFVYVQNDKVQEVKKMLQTALEGQALVCETAELIEEGFFGSKPVSNDFLKRVGNLVILAYGNNSIWWYEKGRFEQKFFAMHGGLTREEMETIFLFTHE